MNRNWKQNVGALLLGTSLIAFTNDGYAAKSPPKANTNKPLLKAKAPVSAKKTPAKLPVMIPPRPRAAPGVVSKKPAGSVARASSKPPVSGNAPKNLSAANDSTLRLAAAPQSKTAPDAVAKRKKKGSAGKGNTSSQSPSWTKTTEKGKENGGSTVGTRLMPLEKRSDGLITGLVSGVPKAPIESPLATRGQSAGNGVAGILKPLIGVPTKPIQAVLTDLPQGFIGVSLDPSANVLPAKQGSLSSFNLTRDNPFLTGAMSPRNRLDNMAAGIAGGTQGTSRAEAQAAFLSGMNASNTAMMAETKAEYDWARGTRISQASHPVLAVAAGVAAVIVYKALEPETDWWAKKIREVADDVVFDNKPEATVTSPQEEIIVVNAPAKGSGTPTPDDEGGDGPPPKLQLGTETKQTLRFVKGKNMIANPDPDKIRHQKPIMDAARPASPRAGQDSTPVPDDGTGNSVRTGTVRTGTVRDLKHLISNPGKDSPKPAPPRPSLPGSPGTSGPSGIVGTPKGDS